MANKRCKLYDETLVHNIMLSTGLSIVEYLRENARADSEEICDFVEANADVIINDTIQHLKDLNSAPGKDDERSEWSREDEEEEV